MYYQGFLLEVKISKFMSIKYLKTLQASETVYRALVARGFIKPIPNGDILLFSLTLACLFRWFQTAHDKSNFLYKLLRYKPYEDFSFISTLLASHL